MRFRLPGNEPTKDRLNKQRKKREKAKERGRDRGLWDRLKGQFIVPASRKGGNQTGQIRRPFPASLPRSVRHALSKHLTGKNMKVRICRTLVMAMARYDWIRKDGSPSAWKILMIAYKPMNVTWLHLQVGRGV